MKANTILLLAVLACSSVSFGQSSGASSEGTSSRTQGGTSSTIEKDRSHSVYDSTTKPDQRLNKKTRQGQVSPDAMQSDADRAKDTDRSGHKTDEAPSIRE